MLLLKDAIAFGREEPTSLLHRTRCRPLILLSAAEGPEAGRISLCGLTRRPSLAPLPALRSISSSHDVHPSMPLLVEIEHRWGKPGQGKLQLLRFDGSIALEIPTPPRTEGSPERVTPGYADCRFDESGRYLWCVANLTEDQVEVQLRETDSWSVVSRVLVDDPFGDGSSAMLLPTMEPGTLSLSLTEAGSGTYVYWVTRHGVHIRCSPEPCCYCDSPPVFSPSGGEFLVIEFKGVQRFRYPVVQLVGVCESPFGGDDPSPDWLCYLDDRRALVGSIDGRIALLDTPTMRVVNELTIEGHEPRPVAEYYPTLTSNGELCTDLSSFTRLGDYLIFFHAGDRTSSSHVEGRDDEETKGMLCFPVSYILDRYAP